MKIAIRAVMVVDIQTRPPKMRIKKIHSFFCKLLNVWPKYSSIIAARKNENVRPPKLPFFAAGK